MRHSHHPLCFYSKKMIADWCMTHGISSLENIPRTEKRLDSCVTQVTKNSSMHSGFSKLLVKAVWKGWRECRITLDGTVQTLAYLIRKVGSAHPGLIKFYHILDSYLYMSLQFFHTISSLSYQIVSHKVLQLQIVVRLLFFVLFLLWLLLLWFFVCLFV